MDTKKHSKKVNLKIGDSGNDADSFVSVDQEGFMASIIGISDTVILHFHWLANALAVPIRPFLQFFRFRRTEDSLCGPIACYVFNGNGNWRNR